MVADMDVSLIVCFYCFRPSALARFLSLDTIDNGVFSLAFYSRMNFPICLVILIPTLVMHNAINF